MLETEPNGGSCVEVPIAARMSITPSRPNSRSYKGNAMVITTAHITPLVALLAGILILLMPRLLNFIVAIYLIIIGLVGLNGIYHFVH
jgi:hypothetical protein